MIALIVITGIGVAFSHFPPFATGTTGAGAARGVKLALRSSAGASRAISRWRACAAAWSAPDRLGLELTHLRFSATGHSGRGAALALPIRHRRHAEKQRSRG